MVVVVVVVDEESRSLPPAFAVAPLMIAHLSSAVSDPFSLTVL